MKKDEQSFGRFVEERRKAAGITLRSFSRMLNIAPAYLSDIEKGRRYPPNGKLEEISKLLKIVGEDKNTMLDKAAQAKTNAVPYDLPEYIMKKDLVRVALRRAKEGNLSDKGWREVIEVIEKNIDDK
jgi:transcriptional regulator with XRE-family HTH domain